MVNPSAHASHILVKSKGEATQLAMNIKKFKDFQKTARKKFPDMNVGLRRKMLAQGQWTEPAEN